jgi:hypothetical protein
MNGAIRRFPDNAIISLDSPALVDPDLEGVDGPFAHKISDRRAVMVSDRAPKILCSCVNLCLFTFVFL